MTKSHGQFWTFLARTPWRQISWERELRMWAGLVLFAFVTMHLMNHALGVLGVQTMEAAQEWRVFLWRTWPGTIALYGAAAVHGPRLEAHRIEARLPHAIRGRCSDLPGLSIPMLVVEHAIGTRYGSAYLGTDDLPGRLTCPLSRQIAWQTALVLVAWFHGIIGSTTSFVISPGSAGCGARLRARILAALLAIAGFVSMGARHSPSISRPAYTPEQMAGLHQAAQLSHQLLAGTGRLGDGDHAGRRPRSTHERHRAPCASWATER